MSLLDRFLGRGSSQSVDWSGHGAFELQKRGARAGFGPVTVDWLGHPVDFIPDPDTAAKVREAIPTADALLADQQRWQSEIRDVAIRDAYPLWKEHYRGDAPLMSQDAWWQEISIMFVAFDTEGRFEFMLWGGDGPLGGMKFVAGGTIGGGVTYATD